MPMKFEEAGGVMTEFLHFNIIFEFSWPVYWLFFTEFFSVQKFAPNLAVSFPFYCSQLDFLHLDSVSQVY